MLSIASTERHGVGIECVVGDLAFVVPSASVAHLVEYDVARLPLASPWIAGLAVHGEELLVSVRLDEASLGTATSRRAKAIVLAARDAKRPTLVRTSPSASLSVARCAVEVDLVVSFVTLVDRRAPERDATPRAPWFSPASTSDGRVVSRLDVGCLLDHLGMGGAGR